ncbi:MAG: ATP-dependent endonuclease [Flavobacteriales bacterium]|nr:MAG: AAA family ATPase [Bacteroidota bacterium]KXK34044.1 MAG: hypothetical protein UZ06_CHB003001446 [Chlorobi bacterium OLB6]MBE2265150.1 ATP-dependent endonuclease [Flavobacteriales bacterium]MBV6462731.1 hypothetical protein [Chlorobiota bacterium]MBW7852621.1 ATP-dependent endonuclease [Candidatus Kapabacteria bacterium]MCC6331119.1 ATP-dependent endonuclease [Ignavibacteria bacterium]
MRLAALQIRNYKSIGPIRCDIKIDEILVLVGPNNSGKSTILDAYEAFASGGKELDDNHFHNTNITTPIEITGVFNSITQDDEATIGSKWKHRHEDYGDCIIVRWVWSKPGQKAQKQSYDPETNNFTDGGVGGWDSLIQSRIPQPVRIKPTDPVEITQTKIVGMLKEHVKNRLKDDAGSTQAAFREIESLARQIFDASKESLDEFAERITENVSRVFPETSIEIVPRSKDAIDEKLVAADSYIRVATRSGQASPLLLQGTGLQRAMLWSTLSVLSESTGKKKQRAPDDYQRILLIDEPEAFLHPPTVRSARDSLYNFALNNSSWQVIATTHSPIFIDLAKDHTTIVRVDTQNEVQRFVSTDQMQFSEDERKNLSMVRACNPIVNEFFFYDRVVLVEGPTEHLIVKHVAERLQMDVHVIDCMGKGNIPTFGRILNQFNMPYTVIHDSDTPKVNRNGVMVVNGAWTLNNLIRGVVEQSRHGNIFIQFPNFEGRFFEEEYSSAKVDRALSLISMPDSDEYASVVDAYSRILSGDGTVFTNTEVEFEQKKSQYVADNSLGENPLWT